MKRYFAYTRVSTVKQGEKGSSLQEQQTAIDAYARRHGLDIVNWFEERETAAKQGRPIFAQMLRAIEQGLATGVVTHKIDRGARNLRDWVTLMDLHDSGIELHFAHESIDFDSRGGRLSADIQAVVAADYIRNLREEVRKGFYGRLKQGFYPLPAPVGYLDRGAGVAKDIDPIRGPLVAAAFSLYASGAWSLDTIADELFARGLRAKTGGRVSKNGFSTIFNNPFYVGLIRIDRTGEIFHGAHAPLIEKDLFDRVQGVLKGRVTHRATGYRFRYQRMLRCAVCLRSLSATRQKGFVYYRCHTKTCPTTCLREDRIDEALRIAAKGILLPESDWDAVRADIDAQILVHRGDAAKDIQSLSLAMIDANERLGRLTDAYIDRIVDKETYLDRKRRLLEQRAEMSSRRRSLETNGDEIGDQVVKMFELAKSLSDMPFGADDANLRETLKNVTSNLFVAGKNVVVDWANPFRNLVSGPVVTSGGPAGAKPRTGVERVKSILTDYFLALIKTEQSSRANIDEPPIVQDAA